MGLNGSSAKTLDDVYGNVPPAEFLDGLADVTRSIVNKQPPAGLPIYGIPWLSIRERMNQNGKAPEEAFHEFITTDFDLPIASALSELVFLQKNEILAWQAKMAAQAGKRAKTTDYIHAIHNLGYALRLNLATDEIEVNGVQITDTLRHEILGRLYDAGFKLERVATYAMAMEAWKNKYHPIRKYLSSIAWDGGKHIETLTLHFQDERDVIGTFLRRWMIGACARAFEKTQNRVLVLDGPQGIGKSKFAQWICAMPGYFYEGPILTDDKDSLVRALNKWIWEISELGNTTRKADREALKAFLSMEEVSVRKAYARFERHGIALVNFIGTVNNEVGILSDPTGSRRFMIAHVQKIDWRSYIKLDVNQCWAEAMAAYLDGEDWNLNEQERKIAGEINEEYEIDDPVEAALYKYFKIDPSNTNFWTSTLNIEEHLQMKDMKFSNPKAASMAIGSACKRIGLRRTKRTISSGRLWGYEGIEIVPFGP